MRSSRRPRTLPEWLTRIVMSPSTPCAWLKPEPVRWTHALAPALNGRSVEPGHHPDPIMLGAGRKIHALHRPAQSLIGPGWWPGSTDRPLRAGANACVHLTGSGFSHAHGVDGDITILVSHSGSVRGLRDERILAPDTASPN